MLFRKNKKNVDAQEPTNYESKKADFGSSTHKIERDLVLKVAEAQQDDIGQNSVRIGTAWMKQLDVKPGDFVEVEGNRKTVAKVDRAHPGDLGLNIIRMDGTTRKNAKAAVGENVILRTAKIFEADVVNLSPLSNVSVRGAENLIGRLLLDKAISNGDIITLGSGGRNSFSSFFGDDIMSIFENTAFPSFQFGFSELRFLVTSTAPKGFVIITENTDINISQKVIDANSELDTLPFSLGAETNDHNIIWLIDHYDKFPIQKESILTTLRDYEKSIDFDLIFEPAARMSSNNGKKVLQHFSFPVIPSTVGKAKIKIIAKANKYGAIDLVVKDPIQNSESLIYSTKELRESPETSAKSLLESINIMLDSLEKKLTKIDRDTLVKSRVGIINAIKSKDNKKIEQEVSFAKHLLDEFATKIYK
jgi:transitional endoplasmic reticulum ATPase